MQPPAAERRSAAKQHDRLQLPIPALQMVMGEVPNKDAPDEGGIIVEGVMGLELKRSRVQHTVFTVSRHSHKWCLPNERMAAVGARMTPCGPCDCNCSAAVAVAAMKGPATLCHGMDPAVFTQNRQGSSHAVESARSVL